MRIGIRTLGLLVVVLFTMSSSLQAFAALDWSGSGEPDYSALNLAQVLAQLPFGRKPPFDVIRQAFSGSQIALVNRDGSLSGEKGQGLKVDSWNVDLLPEAKAKGISMTLDQLIMNIQYAHDGLKNQLPATLTVDPQLRAEFLKDLRRMTQLDESDQTGIRHMSHLIVQIGLNAENPYDLLDANVRGDVKLDSLQIFLLLHRFSAELSVYAKKFKPIQSDLSHISKMMADFSLAFVKQAPCQMSETEGLVMDGAATGSGLVLGGVAGFPGVIDWLEKMKFVQDTQVEKFGNISAVANIAGNVAKLLVTMWSFRAEIKAVPWPLERTKNTQAGKEAKITAKFWLDTGNAQVVNCIRPALNAIGLDFSLPSNGPLAGSLAEWLILTRVGAANDVVETYGSDPLHGITDGNGVTEITVRGKAQKKDLTHKALIQIERTVPVRAQINLKNKNGTQDIIDVAAGLGGISALWSVPFELLNRMPLIFGADVQIKVLDWKELEGDLFEINATYHDPKREDSFSAKMLDVTDGFLARMEVKVVDREHTTAEILSFTDAQTQYRDDFPASFPVGEGCHGSQSPTSRYEVFTHMPLRTEVLAHYFEGHYYPPEMPLPPGVPAHEDARVLVEMKTQGIEMTRGWHYTYDHPSCPLEDTLPDEHDVQLYLKFDSKQLNQVGQTILQDQRDLQTGIGWVFEITYEK